MEAMTTECSLCGNEFNEEESENPQLDDDGTPICDECHHEHHEFTCCCCCNYGDVKDQHKMLVVFDECHSMGGPTRKITPGVYSIIEFPYHGGPMIGEGWLYGDSLERVAELNNDICGGGYPCGHLCIDCQQKVLAQFTAKCSVCKAKSPSCLKVKLGCWKDLENNKYQWTRAKIVCSTCRHAHKGSWEMVKN